MICFFVFLFSCAHFFTGTAIAAQKSENIKKECDPKQDAPELCYVSETIKKIRSLASGEENKENFAKALSEHCDLNHMAQYAFGGIKKEYLDSVKWDRAKLLDFVNEYFPKFLKAFKSHIIVTYSTEPKRSTFRQSQAEFGKVLKESGFVTVETFFTFPSDKTKKIKVNWIVGKDQSGKLKIRNIVIESIDVLMAEQRVVTELYKKNESNIDAFLTKYAAHQEGVIK